MVPEPEYDIFVSHNQQQKPWVRRFCRMLREVGLRVFFDEDSIKPGEQVVPAIEHGIESSRHIFLMISTAALKSHWVALETAMAIYSDADNAKRTLIPILLEPVDRALLGLSIRRLNLLDLSDARTRIEKLVYLFKTLNIFTSDAVLADLWAADEHSGARQDLQVANISDVLAWGWNGDKLLDELIRLDYETIDGLTPDHEGQISQWAPVFMDHPDTWRLIIEEPAKLAGYWHFVPLFDREIQLVRQGRLIDGDITTDKVRLFEIPGQYDIYFVSLCIKPQFRRSFAVSPLLRSLLAIMRDLAREGVFFRDVYANAYTKSGEAICKSFDLRPLVNHTSHGQIFGRRVYPFPPLRSVSEFTDLVTMYGREFWQAKQPITA